METTMYVTAQNPQTTIFAVKRIATAGVLAGAIGLAALGLGGGIAAASPAGPSGSGPSAPSASHHRDGAHSVPRPNTSTDDSDAHAHLIPGFKPKPIVTGGTHGTSATRPNTATAAAAAPLADDDEPYSCSKGPGYDFIGHHAGEAC